MSRNRMADGLFVAALMVYVLAGVALTPIHADEFMQMAMARDVSYLMRGDLAQIRFTPPILPDTEQHLRLLNGPLNKYLIGAVWAINGRSADTLPGIFAWAMPLEWNQAQGNVPTTDALALARLPSALLTALSVAAIFGLGAYIGGRVMAYPAALLYTLHPVILLNGRRAMMEGGLLFCTLGLIGVALWLGQPKTHWSVRNVAILGVCAGLTVAAKHSGLIVVISVFAALLWTRWRIDRGPILIGLGGAGLIALLVFFILNPAYWNDPVGAARATLEARTALLGMQARNDPTTYSDPFQRVTATLTQPFLMPPQYYEAPTWNGIIDDLIQQYEASPVSGWRWPGLVGALLTALACLGGALLAFQALRKADPGARVLIAWLAAALIGGLAIPLAWQRYYLPLFPILIMLVAYVPYAIRLRFRQQ